MFKSIGKWIDSLPSQAERAELKRDRIKCDNCKKRAGWDQVGHPRRKQQPWPSRGVWVIATRFACRNCGFRDDFI